MDCSLIPLLILNYCYVTAIRNNVVLLYVTMRYCYVIRYLREIVRKSFSSELWEYAIIIRKFQWSCLILVSRIVRSDRHYFFFLIHVNFIILKMCKRLKISFSIPSINMQLHTNHACSPISKLLCCLLCVYNIYRSRSANFLLIFIY